MKIKIICENCSKEFERRKAEVNRSQRLGRKNYCSRKCACKNNIDNIPMHLRKNPQNLIPNNRSDHLSRFRWYIKVAKQRKNKEFNLTLAYLEKLWKQQNGKCSLSGVSLVLRSHSDNSRATPNSASLDRIDSSKGYVKGNVRFVSLIANMAKHTFGDEDVFDFCNNVVKHQRKISNEKID